MIKRYLFSPLRAITVDNSQAGNALFVHFFTVVFFHTLGLFFYFELYRYYFDTMLLLGFGIFAIVAGWCFAWYVMKYVEAPKDNNWKWKLLGFLFFVEPYLFLIVCTIAVIGLPSQ